MEDRDLLYRVHVARYRAHYGKNFDIEKTKWPKNNKEWNQTGHGAPWDTNVIMARFHLQLYYDLKEVVDGPSV